VAWVEGQRAVERATTAKRGLDMVKFRQAKTEAALLKSLVETEVALQSSLEALELERKAWSEVDQEVLVLRGQVLGTEELNARLREQVIRREEGVSILNNIKSLGWVNLFQYHFEQHAVVLRHALTAHQAVFSRGVVFGDLDREALALEFDRRTARAGGQCRDHGEQRGCAQANGCFHHRFSRWNLADRVQLSA